MSQAFQRIAIVNRGEPAMRLVNAARELAEERGEPLVTIALHTEPDRRSMVVRQADEAYDLGPPTYVDARDGQRKVAYLDYDRLERALVDTGAEAAWVGWGFVAEHAAFAELCERLGVVFVGPGAEVMRKLGDKITSKRIAEEAKVPIAPWSGGPVETLEEAREQAGRLGYPLMLKATAGGGGRGIRRLTSDEELAARFESARVEAHRAFGDPTVFLERAVLGARHVEVQVLADRRGRTWALGVRDCTIQRRNQKILEETPSPALTAKQDRDLRKAAARLCRAAGYVNAGTVEFLYDPGEKTFHFMEVNTRLQVEHPVTEAVTGVDLVKLQLHVARGGRLEGDPPPPRGHAVEVRLNAEDPERAFSPAPGTVELFRLPAGPGLRIDTGVEEGDEIPAEFDSMIAKLISWGADREEALGRLSRALAQTSVIVRGGTTNKSFLAGLLKRPEVASGEVEVGWMDRLVAAGEHLARRHAAVALVEAAIEAYEAETDLERNRFLAAARRGRPEVADRLGHRVELGYQGHTYPFHVHRLGPHSYRLAIDGAELRVRAGRTGPAGRRLTCAGRDHRIVSSVQGAEHLVEVDGEAHRVSRDDAGVVRAHAPAVVVSVEVKAGDRVEPGDPLLVLEAMKMEMPVAAEFPGVVRRVLVRSNVQVPAGTPLLMVEPAEAAAGARRERLDFAALAAAPETAEGGDTRCEQLFDDLRRLLLGYDVDPTEIHARIAEHGLLCDGLEPDDGRLLELEDRVLAAFVDICALFRPLPAQDEAPEWERPQSSRELFFEYLRKPEGEGRGLPPEFRGRLACALEHFGIAALERTSELEESLFRICRSHGRMERQVQPIFALLERRLAHVDRLRPSLGDGFRELLDRLAEASRGRFPALHDVGREAAYRFFHEPFLERVDRRVAGEVEEHLATLEGRPKDGERRAAIDALVDCPQPLHGRLSRRFAEAPRRAVPALLEVMARRYYRIRDLAEPEHFSVDRIAFLRSSYEHRGERLQLLVAWARVEKLEAAAAALAGACARLPEGDEVVVDLYLGGRPGSARPDPDETRDRLLRALAGEELPRSILRLAAVISGGDAPRRAGGAQVLTLRPAEGGLREERVTRGIHPMLAKRLELRLLEAFDLERLPSSEEIFLFHAVARDNPGDERLLAFAEVRDLTALAGGGDGAPHFPQLERILFEALAAIRGVQARRPIRDRLYWNRIFLHVWPDLELPPGEVRRLAERFRPDAEGLGLEKVVVRARLPRPGGGVAQTTVLEISNPGGRGVLVRYREPSDRPLEPLDAYTQKVVKLRRRDLPYPYEVVKMLAPPRSGAETDLPAGEFVEYDLDAAGEPVPVAREHGGNEANVVLGVIRNFTAKHPEGMSRVILLGDPSRGMGNLAEAECRRIVGALDLAERLGVPLEWFAISAGARIAMDSGTENMDSIALVLRRLVEFTQAGGEVNIVITGINVGAQPYWNAEATMLMHTRGVLIMMPESAMVLTGKEALDYSGGVSAEDNQGIGGYERIMGPNGQAQYFAADLDQACRTLLRHYEHTYRAPGEATPRRAPTDDPRDRDVTSSPHGGDFATVGEIFSDATNPGRKRPFHIRRVMMAVADQDHRPLERWIGMEEAEIGVVWDAHVGGFPVTLLGFESHPLPRFGYVPADGPEQWTSGTLFPRSSKKIARAINAASGNRPVVVLANLSGFDGSPESMREWQLEYGAEIGRAVVNFRGPFVFVDISRYHGGAFVVFSNALSDNMRVAALEGTYASVIGGAPAAAVVFSRRVDQRAREDARIAELDAELAAASGPDKARLQARRGELWESVRSEKLGEVADEFDDVHSVERARRVGSVDEIIPPGRLRPWIIEAIEDGLARDAGAARE